AEGIYYFSGGLLTRVVDSTVQIPTVPPGNPFVGFSTASLDGNRVAFLGARNVGLLDYEGIWVWRAGSMAVVVEKGDPVPGIAGGVFFFLFPPSMSAGEVIWNGYVATPGSDRRGIHSNRGGIHTLVDTTDTIPGSGIPFTDFCFNPTVGSQVGFTGGADLGTFTGVWGHDDGLPPGLEIFVVADQSTNVPGTNQNFSSFYAGVTARAGEFAFRATSGTQLGVYSSAGGLHTVADTNTTIPGSSLPFTGFNQRSQHGPAIDGNGDTAFVGEGAGGLRGIYVERGGLLQRVVETGDMLSGKTVSTVDLGREGFDGGVLVFVLGFTDASSGVFVLKL
ncbi:MAG: choice-of-anchor tandem repeat NxxGxxAF-containing protein, partial [Myxococcota bacterium]